MTIQPAQTTTGTSSDTGATPGALSLTLPPTTYAKLLPHKFLAAHLPSTRPDGRTPSSYRSASLHTGSLTHAHGSAVVRIGDSAAVCGIRAEILNARDTDIPADFDARHGTGTSGADAARIAALGLLVPNVELNTGCHPAFLPGSAPGQIAQALTHRLLGMLRIADVVDLEGLCIYEEDDGNRNKTEDMDDDLPIEREVKAYYTLYIDILFLSLSGPHSAFDTAWLAIQSALRDTKLPAARWDKDADGVLCDPRRHNYKTMGIRSYSVALSWSAFTPEHVGEGNASEGGDMVILVDPDDFEESCCAETGLVVADFDSGATLGAETGAGAGRILRIEKNGGQHVAGAELRGILDVSRRRWAEWKLLLDMKQDRP